MAAMTPRQHKAITCPLTRAFGDISPYRQVRKHATWRWTVEAA